MINKYSLGGQLLRNVLRGITKGELSYKGINGVANSFSKRVPELKNLLNKLASSTKNSTKLGEDESKRLIELINQHRGNFRSLDKIIPERLRKTYPIVPVQASGKAKEKTAQQVEKELTSSIEQGVLGTPKRGHYLSKGTLTYSVAPELRSTLRRGSRAARLSTPTSPVVTETATPASSVVAVAPTVEQKNLTLKSIWDGTKNWMNNHPGWTIGIPAVGLGTGPGRWLLGNAFKATQSSPDSWFEDNSTTNSNSESSDFIVINGKKIPIKRSPDGYFVPVDTSLKDTQQSSGSTDDIDSIINEINSDTQTQQQIASQAENQETDQMPQYTQQDINDLFATDQW